MKRLCLPGIIIVMLMVLNGCGVKSYVVLSPPVELGFDQSKIDSLAAAYPDEDIIYSNYSETVEYGNTIIMDREVYAYFNTVEREYIIMDPTNEWHDRFGTYTNQYQKLQAVYLRVLYPDGSINIYSLEDCIVENLGDNRTHYKISYPNIVKGTIVQEGYQIREDFSQFNYHFTGMMDLDHNDPCQKSSFTMNLPTDASFSRKKVGEEEPFVKDKRTTDDGRTIVTYTAENLDSYVNESYSPYRKDNGLYIKYRINKLGMLDLSQSWEDVISYILKNIPTQKGKQFFYGTRFDDVVDSLTVDADTEVAKIRSIVNYLQDNIEITYDEIYDCGAKILNKGKANPYQFCGLAKLMLEQIGVNSNLIICHHPMNGYLDPLYADLQQYPLPGLRIGIDGEYQYSFPYFAYLKWNQIPADLSGQPAMLVTGSYDPANRITLPEAASEDNTVEEEYDITILDDGTLHVKQTLVAYGSSAYAFRKAWEKLENEEQDELMDNMLTWKNINIEDFSYEIANLEDMRKPLRYSFEYTVDNLMSIMMDEAVMQTSGLLEPASVKRYKIDADKRKNSIAIYEDEVYSKIIDIHAPEGWSLQSELADIDYSNEFGNIRATYRKDGNHLHIEQSRNLKRSFAPKEKYLDLLKLGGRRSKLIIPTLIFDIDLS